MTRRSRREIEQALDDLTANDVDGELSDVGRGVTAPFVTYEADGFADPPNGTTVTDVVEDDDAAYRVVRQPAESKGGDGR